MLLLGQFSDDISVYAVKNQKFNIMTLIENILTPVDLVQIPSNLKSLIVGRMFATCTLIVDVINPYQNESQLFMKGVITNSLGVL